MFLEGIERRRSKRKKEKGITTKDARRTEIHLVGALVVDTLALSAARAQATTDFSEERLAKCWCRFLQLLLSSGGAEASGGWGDVAREDVTLTMPVLRSLEGGSSSEPPEATVHLCGLADIARHAQHVSSVFTSAGASACVGPSTSHAPGARAAAPRGIPSAGASSSPASSSWHFRCAAADVMVSPEKELACEFTATSVGLAAAAQLAAEVSFEGMARCSFGSDGRLASAEVVFDVLPLMARLAALRAPRGAAGRT